MLRFYLFLIFFTLYFEFANAQLYVWNGSSNDFQNPTAWTPDRNTPATTDVLQFNSTSPPNSQVLNVPTETIGRFFISQNINVTLVAASGGSTLTLSGGTGNDFFVEAGSSLTFDGNNSNPLEINFGAGVIGEVFGTVAFTNSSGIGSGAAHRILLPNATSSLVFRNSAIFTAGIMTGNPFGNSGAANVVTFESGSVYVFNDGANPFGLAQPASKVIFQTGSLYRHLQSTIPSLAGRTYADFEYNSPGTTSIQNGSLSGCIMDNLSVLQGTFTFLLSSNNNPQNLTLRGNLNVASGAVFNYSPADVLAFSAFTFAGSATQTLDGGGTLIFGNNSNVILNNNNIGSNDIILNRNLSLDGTLTLTNGILNTGVNILSITNATPTAVSAGSDGSHVNGILQRGVLAGSFYNFPVGEGNAIENVRLNVDCPGDYTARFNNTTPATTALIPFSDGNGNFSELLTKGFWTINSTCVGTPTYELRLFGRDFPDFPNGKPAFTIAKRNTPTDDWQQNGTLSNPDNTLNGFQTSDGSIRRVNMTGFSDFAIVASPVTSLPVDFIYFRAKPEENGNVLEWKTVHEQNNAGFEAERSADGKSFQKIGFINAGKSENQVYFFRDENPLSQNYYRLKQIDKNGNFAYSKTIFLSGTRAETFVQVYPNPTAGDITLDLPFPEEADLQVFNVQSILFVKTSGNASALSEKLSQSLKNAPAGVYFLLIRQNNKIFRTKVAKM